MDMVFIFCRASVNSPALFISENSRTLEHGFPKSGIALIGRGPSKPRHSACGQPAHAGQRNLPRESLEK